MFWKYATFLSVVLLGFVLVYIFDDGDFTTISRIDLVAAFMGLVLFTGGLLGCVALLGRTLRQEPVTPRARVWWEVARTEGRKKFVWKVTLATTVIAGGSVSMLILSNASGDDSYLVPILGCVLMLVTISLASYAVADRLWEFFETRLKVVEENTERRLLESERLGDLEVRAAGEEFTRSDTDHVRR